MKKTLILLLLFFCVTCAVAQEAAVPVDSVVSVPADSVDFPDREIELDAITVTAKTRTRDAEKETFLVTNAMRKNTVSAAQMLGNVPGVSVDWATESIKVDNFRDVPIVVDEQEVSAEYARSINPKRIAKVEILRRPQGKFAGRDIIINLVLKPDYRGWDVGARAGGLLVLNNGNSNSENASANFNLSDRKWNFYLTSGYNRYDARSATSYVNRYFDEITVETDETDEKSPNGRSDGQGFDVTAGLMYSLSAKHSIFTQVSANAARNATDTDYRIRQSGLPGASGAEAVGETSLSDYHNNSYAASVSYGGRFSPSVGLSAVLSYNYYQSRDNYGLLIDDVQASVTSTVNDKNYVSFYVGSYKMFSENFWLTASNMLTWRKYVSRYRPDETEYFRSRETRNSTDVQIGYNVPSRKLGVLAGGTVQLVADKNVSQVSRSRTNVSVAPIVRVSWDIVKNLNMNFYYRLNTYYPTIDQLSPTAYYVDSYTIASGNPGLKSSRSHNGSVEFEFKKILKLTYSLNHTRDDAMPYYVVLDDDNTVLRTPVGGNTVHNYIGLRGSVSPFKNFEWTALASYQHKACYNSDAGRHTGRTWYFDTDLSYYISPLGLNTRLSYFLRHDRSPQLQGSSYDQEERLSITLSRNFLNSRLWVSLQGYIPVEALSKRCWSKIDIPGYKSVTYTDDRVNLARIFVNVRYTIGNEKTHKLDSQINIESEKRSIGIK